jgi:hypothetical protein
MSQLKIKVEKSIIGQIYSHDFAPAFAREAQVIYFAVSENLAVALS